MTQPVLVAVDDDGEVLAALQAALRRRFGADYQILAERSPVAALETLERLHARDETVAVILADQWMPQMTGLELLAEPASYTRRPGGCCCAASGTAASTSR
jgi:thioredoxin reductase (NADPH)